jgi:hypothetical protein
METWFKSRLRLQEKTQFTYHLTLRCVHVNAVTFEKLKMSNILKGFFGSYTVHILLCS